MPFQLANILVVGLVAMGFVLVALTGGKFLRPNAPTAEKSLPYECGEKPIGGGHYNFNPRFYLIALVFVIFEVEIALVYPVASVYKGFVDAGEGGVAFLALGLFVLILGLGLVVVWARGDLDWIRTLRGDERPGARGAPAPLDTPKKAA